MLQEKQYYLKQLENGPISHKRISNRMKTRFATSPAMVKDELLRSGHIELAFTKRTGETNKLDYFFKLTNKKLDGSMMEEKAISTVWDDGTQKSRGNAFDWRNSGSTLYSKREIVQAQQKYQPNQQIITYSRA
jgi:hypothetical protein